MKRLALLLVTLLVTAALAQERSIITVKSGEVSGTVIVLNIQQVEPVIHGKSTFVLQCNKGMMDCAQLTPGTYVMERLPENYGTYVCQNVKLYPATPDSASTEPIGTYCLLEK